MQWQYLIRCFSFGRSGYSSSLNFFRRHPDLLCYLVSGFSVSARVGTKLNLRFAHYPQHSSYATESCDCSRPEERHAQLIGEFVGVDETKFFYRLLSAGIDYTQVFKKPWPDASTCAYGCTHMIMTHCDVACDDFIDNCQLDSLELTAIIDPSRCPQTSLYNRAPLTSLRNQAALSW